MYSEIFDHHACIRNKDKTEKLAWVDNLVYFSREFLQPADIISSNIFILIMYLEYIIFPV